MHGAKLVGILPIILLVLGSPSAVPRATASPEVGSLRLTSSQAHAIPGNFDGPAELPRIYVSSALSGTPTPGKVRMVMEGSDLQEALNSASCGDTIKLQEGVSFPGRFHLPGKPCDDAHWIVIRTSAPDDSLPREGNRILPCYAGIASLPGRPDFHCSSVKD